jgi:hypothetical protein
MSASTDDDDVSSSRITLVEGKVSNGMKKTLHDLMDILQCPLCQDIFTRPATLASCGHSFCEACIDDYNCTHSTCPLPNCRMPMSINGGRGSFRKVNPQLAQCVESMQLVCQGLNKAPKEWWKTNNLVITKASPGLPVEDHTTEGLSYDSDSDMENAIDLQPSITGN